MIPTQLPSEGLAFLDGVQPISQGAGTVTSGWIAAKNFHAFLAIIATGVMGASGTLDAKLQQAQDSGGTGVKDITGKALTQIVKASGDNKVAFINLGCDDLDTNNGFTHFRLSITVGTAASLIDAKVLGFFPRFAPPTQAAAVVQTIA